MRAKRSKLPPFHSSPRHIYYIKSQCLSMYVILIAAMIGISPIIALQHRKLSLWIDKKQITSFIGLKIDIYVIKDGHVAPYLLQQNFIDKLPAIPSQIDMINLTWTAGRKGFTYWFDDLRSLNNWILYNPLLSIPTSGFIPGKVSVFQMTIPCTGFQEGIVRLILGLRIYNEKGQQIRGSPLKLRLKKYCKKHGELQTCHKVCKNGGRCNRSGECECPHNFYGVHCENAMCYPVCENNGTCISSGKCNCLDSFTGKYCETVLCSKPCQNGGHCAGRDICWCSGGFFGDVCQYSQCKKPCLNSGVCVGHDKCLCRSGYKGENCEIENKCKKSCGSHGTCVDFNRCQCDSGWRGRYCHRRKRTLRKNRTYIGRRQPRNRKTSRRSKKRNKLRLGRKKRRRLLAAVRKFQRRKSRRSRGWRKKSRRALKVFHPRKASSSRSANQNRARRWKRT